jgi:uncharacterized Zn-finger protein
MNAQPHGGYGAHDVVGKHPLHPLRIAPVRVQAHPARVGYHPYTKPMAPLRYSDPTPVNRPMIVPYPEQPLSADTMRLHQPGIPSPLGRQQHTQQQSQAQAEDAETQALASTLLAFASASVNTSLGNSSSDLPPLPKSRRGRRPTETSRRDPSTSGVQPIDEGRGSDKRFRCPFSGCNARFSNRGHVERHMRVHTGEKPFKCILPDCTKRFSRRKFIFVGVLSFA